MKHQVCKVLAVVMVVGWERQKEWKVNQMRPTLADRGKCKSAAVRTGDGCVCVCVRARWSGSDCRLTDMGWVREAGSGWW